MGKLLIVGLSAGRLTDEPLDEGLQRNFLGGYTVFGKSPLTETWDDANSGGHFGPNLKFAGYDGVIVTGASDRPVYILIEDGEASLRDASHLWGKSTLETRDALKAAHGGGL
jgi:aldehyde:ferredoxin oxidoreductase